VASLINFMETVWLVAENYRNRETEICKRKYFICLMFLIADFN
jgi:hypothetical protein